MPADLGRDGAADGRTAPQACAEAAGLVENRWRTYVPGLGQYTAPDPEHMLSVMTFAGPQTYSYAAGRPLVNVDPSGRLIDTSGLSAAARGVLANLYSTPAAAWIRPLAESQSVLVTFAEPVQGLRGGGLTHVMPTGTPASGNRPAIPTGFNVVVNLNLADADEYTRRHFQIRTKYEHLLAHELGHAYYNAIEYESATRNTDQEAVRCENALRAGCERRPRH